MKAYSLSALQQLKVKGTNFDSNKGQINKPPSNYDDDDVLIVLCILITYPPQYAGTHMSGKTRVPIL